MKFIDLSVTIENNLPSDPQEMIPQITYIDHEKSIPAMLKFFGSAQKEDLPDELAFRCTISLSSNDGQRPNGLDN